ncbi:MAG TPA: acyl-CoA dehydrogenase family protein, partial [Acetobacteraceae bacterium]|nr:acyl-CoA dehydrogenase family protein [Acetobacteraceae bacterium]
MFLPRSMGGPELPRLTAFRAIEELSKADGSVGWCVMIATVASLFAGWLDTDVGRSIAGTPANLRLAGSLRSQGVARPVGGGYRVSGRWDFASGVNHANWLFCTCKIVDGETPAMTSAGAPLTRSMWIPASKARIEDTWSVVGLRGTGSHDFVIDDVFVPNAYTSSLAEPPRQGGDLYHPRLAFVTIFSANVANALGIARAAIDAFIELARSGSASSPVPLRERPLVQTRVGEAEAILGAARAFVLDAVGAACEAMRGQDPSVAIARARLAITHAVHEAVRAVDLVFHAAGTLGIYTRNPLERCFRDIHVAVHHNAGFPVHYESAGKVFLGLRPTDLGW